MSKDILFVPRHSHVFTLADIDALKGKGYHIHYYDGDDVLVVNDRHIVRYDEVYFKYMDGPEGEPEPLEFDAPHFDYQDEPLPTSFADALKTTAEQAAAREGLRLLQKEVMKIIESKSKGADWPWLKDSFDEWFENKERRGR